MYECRGFLGVAASYRTSDIAMRHLPILLACVSLRAVGGDTETATFACAGAAIPLSWVDDDFCDCADGSDETATAACASISPPPRFACARWIDGVGGLSTARSIPASRVGDGVCDCCDGSDEAAGATVCPDRCAALRVELEAKLAKRRALLARGLAARTLQLAEVSSMRQRWRADVAALQLRVDEAIVAEIRAKAARDAAVAEESAMKRQRARFEANDWADDVVDELGAASDAGEGRHLLSWQRKHCESPAAEVVAAAETAGESESAPPERSTSDAAPAAEVDVGGADADGAASAAATVGDSTAASDGDGDGDAGAVFATVEVALNGEQRELERADADALLAPADGGADAVAARAEAASALDLERGLERAAAARCADDDLAFATLPACACAAGATFIPTPQRVRFALLDAELPLTGAWLDCVGVVFSLPRFALGALASIWRRAVAAVGLRSRAGDGADGLWVDHTTEWAIARAWGAVPALWVRVPKLWCNQCFKVIRIVRNTIVV